MGKDYSLEFRISNLESRPLWQHIERTTFPGVQGTPYLNNIAAKAVFFKETLCDEYRQRQFKIIENAKALAESLLHLGHDVVTGGTDNHMILVNVANLREGLTGLVAQKCLEDCGIVVNMNRLPYDKKGPTITSGIRLGTPIVTKNGIGPEEMHAIAQLIDAVLRKVEILSDTEFRMDHSFQNQTKQKVEALCSKFPMQ
jgi:glycine hydroxymethyltransferase